MKLVNGLIQMSMGVLRIFNLPQSVKMFAADVPRASESSHAFLASELVGSVLKRDDRLRRHVVNSTYHRCRCKSGLTESRHTFLTSELIGAHLGRYHGVGGSQLVDGPSFRLLLCNGLLQLRRRGSG